MLVDEKRPARPKPKRPKPRPSAVGLRLREQRKQAQMPQKLLAQQAGVTRQWISQVEWGGIQSPGADDLHRVARALQIDPEYLLRGRPRETVTVDLPPAVVDDVRRFARLPDPVRKHLLDTGRAVERLLARLGSPIEELPQGYPQPPLHGSAAEAEGQAAEGAEAAAQREGQAKPEA